MLVQPPVSFDRYDGPGFGGIFSTLLNVAGSFVGDPALGSQVASQASPAYAPVTQDAAQIATQVAPNVLAALKQPLITSLKNIPARDQTVATSTANLQAIAVQLKSQGYQFPAGTLGAEYQMPSPSLFDAFGGQYGGYVQLGAAALGIALLLKVL